MRRTSILLSFSILLLFSIAASKNQTSGRFANVANRMVSAINAGDYEKIQQDFGKEMLNAFPLEKLKPFFQKLTADYEKIKSLDLPRITPPAQAIFPAHFDHIILDIKIALDDNDKIVGLWFLSH